MAKLEKQQKKNQMQMAQIQLDQQLLTTNKSMNHRAISGSVERSIELSQKTPRPDNDFNSFAKSMMNCDQSDKTFQRSFKNIKLDHESYKQLNITYPHNLSAQSSPRTQVNQCSPRNQQSEQSLQSQMTKQWNVNQEIQNIKQDQTTGLRKQSSAERKFQSDFMNMSTDNFKFANHNSQVSIDNNMFLSKQTQGGDEFSEFQNQKTVRLLNNEDFKNFSKQFMHSPREFQSSSISQSEYHQQNYDGKINQQANLFTPRSQITLEQDFESPIKQMENDLKSEGEIATPPLPYSHSQSKHKLFSSARIVNKNPRSARNFRNKLDIIVEQSTEKEVFENKEVKSNKESRKNKIKIHRKLTRNKKSMKSLAKEYQTFKDVTIPYEAQKPMDHQNLFAINIDDNSSLDEYGIFEISKPTEQRKEKQIEERAPTRKSMKTPYFTPGQVRQQGQPKIGKGKGAIGYDPVSMSDIGDPTDAQQTTDEKAPLTQSFCQPQSTDQTN